MTQSRWLAVAAVLLLGSAAYWAKGVTLLFAESGGVDLRQRWLEQQYVFRGQNPFDVTYAAFGTGKPPRHPRPSDADPDLGPTDGGYPGWAYTTGALWLWPPWPAMKPTFLLLSVISAGTIAAWAYRLGRRRGFCEGVFLAAAATAISATSTTVHVGQYGLIVTALLFGTLVACEAEAAVAGGILLGMALLKPTIAGPFVLALAIGGQWLAAAVALAYVAVSAAAVSYWVNTPPDEMLSQLLANGATYVDDRSAGLVIPLMALGLSRSAVTPLLAGGVMLPATAWMVALRRRPMLDLFAVAAVAGRLWSYHKNYDNMMLVFLLAALGVRVIRPGVSSWTVAAFVAAGVSLGTPAGLTESAGFLSFQIVAWLAGLAAISWDRIDHDAAR